MDYTAEENISEMKGSIDSWFQKFLHVYKGQGCISQSCARVSEAVPEY